MFSLKPTFIITSRHSEPGDLQNVQICRIPGKWAVRVGEIQLIGFRNNGNYEDIMTAD